MKLKELFQAYEFDEIYPQIGLMFPKGRHLRNEFRNAYDLLLSINPVLSKMGCVIRQGSEERTESRPHE